MIESLRKIHEIKLNSLDTYFTRYLLDTLPWSDRLMGIKGFRGVGKTTMMLQYIKNTYGFSYEALYISLDNFYFAGNRLFDLAENFVATGGKHLFIDEIHKYPDWSVELKNIYDTFSGLKITFTGSSLLEILQSSADLSRRALVFKMQGLSFREYLNFVLKTNFLPVDITDIIDHHRDIALDISKKIKPLKYFPTYLKSGYYPFFITDTIYYHHRIQEIINLTIDVEFPQLRGVDPLNTRKIKQLLFVISLSGPFKPNISKLARKINISRNTLLEYIKILADADLLKLLNKDSLGINLLQKPEKIFLENPNFAYTFSDITPDKGNIREAFFLNQVAAKYSVTYPDKGDFLVNNQYLFEIGGKTKSRKQIAVIDNAYVVADDTEVGYRNKIPIWLFGFLY